MSQVLAVISDHIADWQCKQPRAKNETCVVYVGTKVAMQLAIELSAMHEGPNSKSASDIFGLLQMPSGLTLRGMRCLKHQLCKVNEIIVATELVPR